MTSKQALDEIELIKLLRLCTEVHLQCRTCMNVVNGRWSTRISWRSNTSSTESILTTLKKLNIILDSDFLDIIKRLYSFAGDYDYPGIRANGIRSFLIIVTQCLTSLLTYLRSLNTYSWISLSGTINHLLVAYVNCLGELHTCLQLLGDIPYFCNPGCLFPRSVYSGLPEIDTCFCTPSANGTASPGFTAIPEHNKTERRQTIDDIHLDARRLHFQNLQTRSDRIRQEYFYGRCLGFYFCPSAQRILLILCSVMAGYSNAYFESKQGLSSLVYTVYRSVSSFLSPEERGCVMAKLTRNADVEFCKAFWRLAEHPLLVDGPHVMSQPLAVAHTFELVPRKLHLPLDSRRRSTPTSESQDEVSAGYIVVDYPTAHGGAAPVTVRLLCSRWRPCLDWAQGSLLSRLLPSAKLGPKSNDLHIANSESNFSPESYSRRSWTSTSTGFPSETSFTGPNSTPGKIPADELSPYLLFYIHGGGFVALKSQSQDMFLRQWAKDLDCPIFCVDYSLAPESPYPRALEECFFAYCWVTLNLEKLGAAPDARIVLCGDSAGGNLALSVCLRIVLEGIVPRPYGALIAYAPVLVSFTPSPARMLSLSDPLLPIGILAKCVLAYAGAEHNHPDADNDDTQTTYPSVDLTTVPKRRSSLTTLLWNRLMSTLWTGLWSNTETSPRGATQHRPSATSSVKTIHDVLSAPGNLSDFDRHGREASFVSAPPVSSNKFSFDLFDPDAVTKDDTTPSTPDTPIRRDPPSDLDRLRQVAFDQDMFMSPYLASDELMSQLPPLGIVCSNFDPFLDDCLELAKRATALKVPVDLRVLDGLPHAFLNFAPLGPEFQNANRVCMDMLLKLFQRDSSDSTPHCSPPPSRTRSPSEESTT